jgi:FAD-linked oxidoreductase
VKRRDFLAASASAAGLVLSGCGPDELPQGPRFTRGGPIRWRNWSGYQHCLPQQRLAPESLEQLVDLLRTAKGPLRPVGAGHSFTPLVPTDGTIVSLRNFLGVLGHDPEALTATVGAGTKLGLLAPQLDALGQALANMPDVDEQSLGGALGTGTHGTGEKLGALHSYVEALKLVTPQGEVLDCSRTRNPQAFEAARVSLGSLGVVTEVTLRNVPSGTLKRRLWIERFDTLLERFDVLAAEHHSFEIYYFPFSDYGVAIAIDPTDEAVRPRANEPDDVSVLDALRHLRDFTRWTPGLRRWLINRLAASAPPEEGVDVWYRVFPSARPVRFNEMEYHLPREALLPTLRKVRETLETKHPEIFFPVEVRLVRGDDAWLSPFQGHAVSGSIAVHHYHAEDPLPYFADIEPLFREAGGRPHWGKMNTLGAADFAALYPRWKDFLDVRAALDPEGKMLNPYLRKVFGL